MNLVVRLFRDGSIRKYCLLYIITAQRPRRSRSLSKGTYTDYTIAAQAFADAMHSLGTYEDPSGSPRYLRRACIHRCSGRIILRRPTILTHI